MARTNVRVTGLIFKGDKILLTHRFREGGEYWTIPGGGVEDGETLEFALHREITEETSLNITSFSHAFDFIQPVMDKLCHFYNVEYTGVPKLGDGPEKENSTAANKYILEWVNIKSISGLDLYPDAAQEVQNFFDRIKS